MKVINHEVARICNEKDLQEDEDANVEGAISKEVEDLEINAVQQAPRVSDIPSRLWNYTGGFIANLLTKAKTQVMGQRLVNNPRPQPFLDVPWRRTAINWDSIEFRDRLIASLVNNESTEPYNILLFASVGAGKTSFVNTVQSALSRRIARVETFEKRDPSTTMRYTTPPVRYGSRQVVAFRLCDSLGVHPNFKNSDEAFNTLIGGNTAEGYTFDNSAKKDGGFTQDKADTRIHCLCFVFNASKLDVLDPADLKAFRNYQSILRQSDVAHVILLTHIDVVEPELEYESFKKVFDSRKIHDVVTRASIKFGTPVNQIFLIKNYTSETVPVLNMDILTLYNLKGILDMCETNRSSC